MLHNPSFFLLECTCIMLEYGVPLASPAAASLSFVFRRSVGHLKQPRPPYPSVSTANVDAALATRNNIARRDAPSLPQKVFCRQK